MKCENPKCGKEHDGSYGSGRFCCKKCRCSAAAQKVKTRKIPDSFKLKHPKAPYGTWKCKKCNLIFETRAQLSQHNHELHPVAKGSAWNKGLTKDTDERIATYVQTCKDRNHYVPFYKGKHLPEEHKRKTSEGMKRYRKTLNYATYSGYTPSYNKSSIPVLESIANNHGWNIQHAENKGEFYVLGYFVDAYDKDKNIVIEYDEPHHYKDVEHNILCEDDLKRQKEIIDYLHCEFWRYNEKTKTLWKAT